MHTYISLIWHKRDRRHLEWEKNEELTRPRRQTVETIVRHQIFTWLENFILPQTDCTEKAEGRHRSEDPRLR